MLLSQAKKEVAINFPKIYGENITVEQVIISQIKPYKFQEHRIEEYKELFYRGFQDFLTNKKYFVAVPFWQKLLKDSFVDGYNELVVKEVHDYVFQKSLEFFRK